MKRDNSYLLNNKFAAGAKPNKAAFKNGHIPWNKNKKGIHQSPSTEFKKGCKSNSILAVGTITYRRLKSKNNHRRAWIKIENPNKWKLLCCYAWEKNNGEIPCGSIIHHKDRNPSNDDIDNLECLTRAEHLKEHRKDAE